MVGLWRLRKRGDFAPAISLGGSAIGFRKVDLDAWLAARPEVT
jgi:predicted DNA-binding transcriptional regulator AlpA